jgi:CheY-like chemotaxis protein
MSGGQRVLVVEDEAIVAVFLEEVLEELGHEVAGIVSRLEEAMARANDRDFDLAILDVHLAGLDVYPFADALASRDIPFIFTTGLDKHVIPEHLRDRPTLQKPFRAEDLSRIIATLMA